MDAPLACKELAIDLEMFWSLLSIKMFWIVQRLGKEENIAWTSAKVVAHVFGVKVGYCMELPVIEA